MSELPSEIRLELKSQLDSRSIKAVKVWLRDHDVADIGEILATLPVDECLRLFRLIPRSRRAEVLLIFRLSGRRPCSRGCQKSH